MLLLLALACDTDPTVKDTSVDTAATETTLDDKDADLDGFSVADGDCNDNSSAVNPGATELCDGLDNDCDGELDEGLTQEFYADADGDGFGDAAVSQIGCEAPEGYIGVAGDCDDTQYRINPSAAEECDGLDNDCDGTPDDGFGAVWYADVDGDGFGDPATETASCEQPAGYIADGTDCDDGDGAVHPGAQEVCDNLDNDCNGTIDDDMGSDWYADVDGDGYGDPGALFYGCLQPAGYVADMTDCDDGQVTVYPGAEELCDNLDNDCNGTVDDDLGSNWYADSDGDGYGDPGALFYGCLQPAGYVADLTDCDDAEPTVNPGGTEVCDNLDNDCNGTVDDGMGRDWYADSDGDGYGDAGASFYGCLQPAGYVTDMTDCDDAEATAYPGAAELCDGIDNDCDGAVDDNLNNDWYADADGDGYGDAGAGYYGCLPPAGYVADATDCDDAEAAANPGEIEVCDGIDNDCDGGVDVGAVDATVWYVDTDGDGYGDPGVSTTSCTAPAGYVADGTDCDDAEAAANPGEVEVCDGIDNDCDGGVDAGAVDASTWYADADADGYGDAGGAVVACDQPAGTVSDRTDCDDGAATVYPGADEYCNGVDDDCDGSVDDNPVEIPTWYADRDSDGYGDPGNTVTGCNQPAGYIADGTDCNDLNSAINPGEAEVCDGVDQDCDGVADDGAIDGSTWYRDADGDGYGDAANALSACTQPAGYITDNTDCDDADATVYPGAPDTYYDGVDSDCDGSLDPDACVTEPPAGTVATNACTYTPAVGSFNPTQEWSVSTFSSQSNYKHSIMTPMVGQLTDDDGDGLLTGSDMPDIAFVAYNRSGGGSDGVLRIWSGDGSAEHLAVRTASYGGQSYAPYRYTNIALGDIDNDGEPEIAAILYRSSNSNCYIGAYNTDGTLQWVYTGATTSCRNSAPALADLEGDGDVEVIVGRTILNGSNGSIQATGTGGYGYYSPYSNSGMIAVPVDIDQDGEMEVIAGNTVYNANGTTQCSTGTTDGYAAVANLDGDSSGEFVVVAGGTIKVFNTDCVQLYSFAVYGGGYGGPPTIADFDGDDTPEIGVAALSYYTVYEINGTRLWSRAITDASSNSTGSSVFDFEGDGAAEVVYADETRLWVFDGATGAVRVEDSRHTSGTINEYPVIADVDNDGNAEIVMTNDGTYTGLMVIGDVDDNWVSARQVWNQHAYSIVNINDDLTIPIVPDPNWPIYNNFREGAPGSLSPTDAPDLYPVSYGSCQATCGQDVEILIQVANEGALFADSTLDIDIYGVTGGVRTLLDTSPLGVDIDPGVLSAVYRFSVPAASILGYASIIAVVDADSEARECDEGDNEVTIDTTGVCL